ncbi:hypothetical protein CWI38_1979p0010 [Hamiltosporidium tvaerminnensis]|uniref:Uncharacterized protein n=1 Tax=Hamiltosporidium tvaerminnensis TaxID=1176355 RepID=A0A4Q9LPN5_9MICR|nr:hypothetical protein CWI38_1979p0010 [Hamiltosporidium tvaerminnensis]
MCYYRGSKGNILKIVRVIHIGDSEGNLYKGSKGNVLKVGDSKGNVLKELGINNSNSNNSSISNGNSVVIKMC